MVHFRGWRISEIYGCNRHATPNASCQKSSSNFKNLTTHVLQAGMVQSELLLGYGLNDLEFESWQGQDFTKHRLALGPSQSPIQQALGFSSRDNGLWHEVDHTPPSSAEVIKAQSCTSTPTHALIMWTGTTNFFQHIQGIPGGMCQTSGQCSLC